MLDVQDWVFRWAAGQAGLTGLALFAAGLLFGFQGFRFFRIILAITCFAVGCGVGTAVASRADLPAAYTAYAVGAVLALLSIRYVRPCVPVACAMTWAALGLFLGQRFEFGLHGSLLVAGIAGLLGAFFAWLCFRSMTIVLSALQGSVLMVLGFVAASNAALPSLSATFRSWSSSSALVVPMLLAMLFTAAYSYQAMHARGDIVCGTVDAEAPTARPSASRPRTAASQSRPPARPR